MCEKQKTFGESVGLPPMVAPQPGPVLSGAPVAVDGACVDCERESSNNLTSESGAIYCPDCHDATFTHCSDCNAELAREDNDDLKSSDDGNDYCESCYDERFTVCCCCSEEVEKGGDDHRTNDGGDDYCDDCYNESYYHCESCSDELSCDETFCAEDGCETLCQHCYEQRYCRCAGRRCSKELEISDAHEFDGEHYCDDCYCEVARECDCCGNVVSSDDISYCERFEADYCDDCMPAECECEDDCDCEAPTSGRSRGSRPQPATSNRGSNRKNRHFQSIKFDRSAITTARTKSARTFGVELETASCAGSDELAGKVHFDAGDDSTINGLEFGSTILAGDAGLDAITVFCGYAEDLDWTVDSKCGYHAHFGVSDLTVDQLKAVALAYKLTERVWHSFVSEARRSNFYSRPIKWGRAELDAAGDSVAEFNAWAKTTSRYQWMNIAAYDSHTTFENRLHSGSLDGEKINNWVVANLRFIDHVSTLTMDQVEALFPGKTVAQLFKALAKIWGEKRLSAYYADRAAKFGSKIAKQPAAPVAYVKADASEMTTVDATWMTSAEV